MAWRSNLGYPRIRKHRELKRATEGYCYEVHSPRIPSTEEMGGNLVAASDVLDPLQLWVYPDCELRPRRWEVVKPALRNMVLAARDMRQTIEAASS